MQKVGSNDVQWFVEPLPGKGRALVLRATGELDVSNLPELRGHLDRTAAAGISRLVVDMSEVTFMDSLTLAALIGAHQRFAGAGRLAIVATPDSFVRLTIEAAGLADRLDLFATRDEGVTFALSAAEPDRRDGAR